jgi:general stress protein 26
MNTDQAAHRARDLMNHAEAVCLTTLDQDGWPQTRAMLNLRNAERYPGLKGIFEANDSDFTLFFTTNTASGKISQITSDKRASAYFCIPSEWRGLMIGGEIRIVHDPEVKQKIWQQDWTMYYPGGCEDPDYTILAIHPRIARYYEYLDSCSWNPVFR